MCKILLSGRVNILLLIGILGVAATGANAFTYTYPNPSVSCSSISINTAGEITCNTGGPAKFYFLKPFPCTSGLKIDFEGRVECATTTPVCSAVSANPAGTVTPGTEVTLTASCSNSPSPGSYEWSSTSDLTSTSQTATATIPSTHPSGYYSSSVMAANDTGFWSTARPLF